MGRKSKLKRFADVAAFPNVMEPVQEYGPMLTNGADEPKEMKGKWGDAFFQNHHPLILELACGKGEYTLALANANPANNYLGLDIKGARIWRGARTALENEIRNAGFLRTRIEFITNFFSRGEVDSIWITFPDPFERKPNRRLTSPPFLERYREILKPGGLMNLKTDSPLLYEFTLETIHNDPQCKVLYADPDIYSRPIAFPELEHKTYYERQHLANGRKIHYIRFTIN